MGGTTAISCSGRFLRRVAFATRGSWNPRAATAGVSGEPAYLVGMSDAADLQSDSGPVYFDRRELELILRVYGRMVAAGEWRDYAMAGHRDVAEFAVFRRSGDAPAYRIEKRPALRLKQGQWAVIGDGGVVLRRGRELPQVLRVFDSRRFSVVE